jgi:hypothetical protein
MLRPKPKYPPITEEEMMELRAIFELVQDPHFETLRQRLDRTKIFDLENQILSVDIDDQKTLVADAKLKGRIKGIKEVFDYAHKCAKEFDERAKNKTGSSPGPGGRQS